MDQERVTEVCEALDTLVEYLRDTLTQAQSAGAAVYLDALQSSVDKLTGATEWEAEPDEPEDDTAPGAA